MKYVDLLAKSREQFSPYRFVAAGELGQVPGRRLLSSKEDLIAIYSTSKSLPPRSTTLKSCEARMATKARILLEGLESGLFSLALRAMDEMSQTWTQKQKKKNRGTDLLAVMVPNHSWVLPLFSSEEVDCAVGMRLLGEYKAIAERLLGCYVDGLIPVGFEENNGDEVIVCVRLQEEHLKK